MKQKQQNQDKLIIQGKITNIKMKYKHTIDKTNKKHKQKTR